jgi:TonB family protein
VAVLNYLLEFNLALALLVPVVWLCLRNETAFAKVRLVLLLTLGACWLLPAVHLPGWSWSEPLITTTATPFSAPPSERVSPMVSMPATAPEIPWATLLLYTYVAGGIFVGVRLLLALLRFFVLVRNTRTTRPTQRVLVTSHASSFAFLGYIFINRSQPKADANIALTHEIWHVRLGHSYDLLVLEVTRTICWWNPAFYLLRTFLREVHEFQADEKTTARYSPHALERVLIENALHPTTPGLSQSMFSKPIFKRIAMIHAEKKSISFCKLAIIGGFATITAVWIGCQEQVQAPIEIALDVLPGSVPENVRKEFSRQKSAHPESEFIVFDLSEQTGQDTFDKLYSEGHFSRDNTIGAAFTYLNDKNERKYAIVRQHPLLQPGGNEIKSIVEKPAQPLFGYDRFRAELAELFNYPAELKEKLEGKVFVEFVVNQDGTLSDFRLLKGIQSEIDAEVLRIMMLVQRWHPAEDKGKIVRMKMVVPVTIADRKVKESR